MSQVVVFWAENMSFRHPSFNGSFAMFTYEKRHDAYVREKNWMMMFSLSVMKPIKFQFNLLDTTEI